MAAHMKKAFLIGTSLLAVAAGTVATVVPRYVESRYNHVLHAPSYRVSEAAQRLYSSVSVVDLHADSLLWNRNLLKRANRGHVDVPRLIEGGVAIQAFTVVTKVPRNLNIERNDGSSDMVKYLAVAEGWPPSTWNSLLGRALFQAESLNKAAAKSDGRFVLIHNKTELDAYLQRRQHESAITAGFLGLEGAHALEGDVSNLDRLYDAGFRMIAPTHFFDNDMAGSSSGVRKGGLTEKGRELVRRAESKHMVIDLAHASPATIDDVTAMATRPLVVSHTGVRGTCNNSRNLADKQLKEVAATGGVIGIGYWKTATCGTDAHAAARAIRYTANLVGVEHVALGSDFDGAVTEPFDATGLPLISEALMKEGFTDEQIRMIMGGNAVRVLREVLPQ
jgi:membrane dipeptidase